MKKFNKWIVYLPVIVYSILFSWPFLNFDNHDNYLQFIVNLAPRLFESEWASFLFIPEFIFVFLAIYWLTRLFTKKIFPMKASEKKAVAFLAVSGYFLWAVPVFVYAIKCTRMFCGHLADVSAPEMYFFDYPQSGTGSVELMGVIIFSMLINAGLIYMLCRVTSSSIIRKLSASDENIPQISNRSEINKKWSIYWPLIAYFILFYWPFFYRQFSGGESSFSIMLSALLGSGAALVLFIPEYVIMSLGIYWLTRYFSKNTTAVAMSERKVVAIIISSGYLLWAVSTVIYATTCSGKFCGFAILIAAPEMLLFYDWLGEAGAAGSISIVAILISINTGLIYLFSRFCVSNIIKRLYKSDKKDAVNIKSHEEKV
jgi:hypothetical protein